MTRNYLVCKKTYIYRVRTDSFVQPHRLGHKSRDDRPGERPKALTLASRTQIVSKDLVGSLPLFDLPPD